MRVLFCGDVIGRSGRQSIKTHLPGLRRDLGLDFVIANGENAAGGFGITASICDELFAAGVDVISGGNHSWDQREVIGYGRKTPESFEDMTRSLYDTLPVNLRAGRAVTSFDARCLTDRLDDHVLEDGASNLAHLPEKDS